jgi:hypothetical protein
MRSRPVYSAELIPRDLPPPATNGRTSRPLSRFNVRRLPNIRAFINGIGGRVQRLRFRSRENLPLAWKDSSEADLARGEKSNRRPEGGFADSKRFFYWPEAAIDSRRRRKYRDFSVAVGSFHSLPGVKLLINASLPFPAECYPFIRNYSH